MTKDDLTSVWCSDTQDERASWDNSQAKSPSYCGSGRVPTAVSLTYERFVSLSAHSSNVLLDKTGDKATPVSM